MANRDLKRSLYQCSNAIVCGDNIECDKLKNKLAPVRWVFLGKPLVLSICQDCAFYDENGPPIPTNERGWR